MGISRTYRRPLRFVFSALLAWAAACTADDPPPRQPVGVHWLDVADSTATYSVVDSDAICRAGCVAVDPLILVGDTLPDGESDAWLVESQAVARLPSGDLWVSQEAAIKIFRQDGEFLTTIGRRGAGPLEFGGNPRPLLVDSAGYVHVFDARNLRETIFTPDGDFIRDNRMAATPRDAALLPGLDRVIIHSRIPDPDRANQPLHILEQGALAVSFGQPLDGSTPNSLQFRRKVAVDGDGRIYAMPEYEYRIEVFDEGGHRLATIVGPELNESLPQSGQVWVTMDNPPRSKVVDLWIDDDWRLWILLEVVESQWREAVSEVRSATGELVIHPTSHDWADVYDTRVDVIELSTLTRVASAVLDVLAFAFGQGHVLFENYTAASGAPQLLIRTVQF